MKLPLLLAMASALAAGCANLSGDAELVGSRYYRSSIDTYPLIVSKVDGKSTPLRGRILVDPGTREILLEEPLQRTGQRTTQRLVLDVQPCTRYFLVAVKDTPLSNDFSVKVDHTEPLGGCKAPAG